jgi:hypothetical protein
MRTLFKFPPLLRFRRLPVAAAALVLLGGVAATASTRGGDRAADAPSGPTATATVRDLVTTLQATGVVERIDQRTISYASVQPKPGADAGDSPTGTATGTSAPAADGTTGPAAPTATTPTTAPATPPSTAPATTSTTDGTDVPDEPSDTAGPTTTTTTAPVPPDNAGPTTTTTTAPVPSGNAGPTTTTTTAAPAEPEPSTTVTTLPASTGTVTSGVAPDTSASTDEEDTPTLTDVLAVSDDAARGTVLYTADDEPTIALFGTIPMWRTLTAGVDAGVDIRQLEENLVALGFGSGITVDNTFSAGTASAVKRWETTLGRADPDGTVELGDVVYLAAAGTVLSHDAIIGEPLESGTPILTVGSDEQVLSAQIPAGEATGWAPGAAVNLTWADGTTTTATVSAVSSDVADGNVDLTVGLTGADRDRPSGAEATVTATDVRHDGVIAVPVAAIVAGTNGGRAVRVPAGGEDRMVAVQTGLVADGWIEITSGLNAGEAVRLPG